MSSSGLIPARAGNTLITDAVTVLVGAHPRSRGEHLVKAAIELAPAGSSPLARGTHVAVGGDVAVVGLIPARAGNTAVRRVVSMVGGGAHPRSRGEHGRESSGKFKSAGSSPLARGTRVDIDIPGLSDGLIPARAGNT